MTYHFEQLLQDSQKYNWEAVRSWSEEVFSQVIAGQLLWENRYEIDRLQNDYSRKSPINDRLLTSSHSNGQRERGLIITLPSQVLQKKPGPPCKLYNQKTCNQASHHTYNGYRQVHVCAFCLWHKCMFLEHPEADCNSKNAGQAFGHGSNGQNSHK